MTNVNVLHLSSRELFGTADDYKRNERLLI